MKRTLVALASLFIAVLAVGPGRAGAIVNGDVDTSHDYVGAIRGLDPTGTPRLCSGSLVGPGVFLTAGHCTRLTDVTVYFGDDIAAPDHVFAATDVLRHPAYNPNNFGFQYDVGLVLFDQGDLALPVGELAPESFVDGFSIAQLKGATFETFGYGLVRDFANGNSDPLEPGTVRRTATQTYLNQHNQYLGLSIHNHKGNGGGCHGDSGGPHLLQGVIVSVTSNGDANCAATDNTQRVDMPEIRSWIEGYLD